MRLLRAFLAWLFFPIAPAFLASAFYHVQFVLTDPREWDVVDWIWQTGPLVGLGFLCGASIGVPDPVLDPPTGWRQWALRPLGQRAVWVAVGPWAGFLFWVATFHVLNTTDKVVQALIGEWPSVPLLDFHGWGTAVFLYVVFLPTYAWIWVVFAGWLLLRARRIGRLGRSLWQGIVTALVFVGSLFGTFWAATESWRGYFFDSRIPSLLLATGSLVLLSGCSIQAWATCAGNICTRRFCRRGSSAWRSAGGGFRGPGGRIDRGRRNHGNASAHFSRRVGTAPHPYSRRVGTAHHP